MKVNEIKKLTIGVEIHSETFSIYLFIYFYFYIILFCKYKKNPSFSR